MNGFNSLMPIFWLVLTIVLGVFEAATVQLVAIWFVAGAIVAIIASLLGAPLWLQIVLFIVVSIITLVITRPFIKKRLNVKEIHTNADSMVGRIGTVLSDITDDSTAGRVMVGGLDWAAVAEDGEYIAKDEKVLIKAISGVKLIVERIF